MAGEGISVRGLQAAIALISAVEADVEVSQEEVLGDTPASEALRAMTGMAAAFLRFSSPGQPWETLRVVGGLAARYEADGAVE